MVISLKELLDSRKTSFEAMKGILDTAEGEKRELSAEETGQYETLDATLEALNEKINAKNEHALRRQKLANLEASILEQAVDRQSDPTQPGVDSKVVTKNKLGPRGTSEYLAQFTAFLRTGNATKLLEQLALQSSKSDQGGYLVAAEQMVRDMLKNVDDAVKLRKLARGFVVPQAKSLGVRCRTTKASTFAYSAELEVSTADSSLRFGKKTLYPHHMTGEISVSRDLVNSSDMDVVAFVVQELARDSGEVEEQGYMTGDGAEKPLGLFTASADGISSGRDMLTGNATGFTGDGLLDALYGLKSSYRSRSTWLFNRNGLKNARKLKDGNGQYMWVPGMREGEADVLLGRPVEDSEFCPGTFTTGLYVGMLGDFGYYWYADALDLEIQVCLELAARQNQTVYIGRRKHDGMPVVEEAFIRLKLN